MHARCVLQAENLRVRQERPVTRRNFVAYRYALSSIAMPAAAPYEYDCHCEPDPSIFWWAFLWGEAEGRLRGVHASRMLSPPHFKKGNMVKRNSMESISLLFKAVCYTAFSSEFNVQLLHK